MPPPIAGLPAPLMTNPLNRRTLLAGLQCTRRAWLESRAERTETHPDARRVLRDESRRVVALARSQYPDGVRVERGEDSVEQTQILLFASGAPALFDAVVATDDVRVRLDIVLRRDSGFHLINVRSGLKIKQGHLRDLAIQRDIAVAAGLNITRVFLCHLRRGGSGGVHSPESHLRTVDVTERLPPPVSFDAAAIRQANASATEPEIEPGPHCTKPWRCPYMVHCGAVNAPHRAQPPQVAREQAKLGLPYIDAALLQALPEGPVASLDFEAFGTSLPEHPDIRPFDAVPFLWVARHSNREDAAVFLGTALDPRRDFITSLLNALDDDYPILVWSNYEHKTLSSLASRFPDLAERIRALQARLLDLHALVRKGYWSAELQGQYSVKAVAGALEPGFSYADLEIVNGRDAALLGLGLRRGLVPERIGAEITRYCERDVLALEVIWRRLRSATASSPPARAPRD